MKIYILLNQPYPNGYALTKRFHLYAKGFINLGHQAKIIIPCPTEVGKELNNKLVSGIFDEVPFLYSWKRTKRSENFITRRYHDFVGFLNVGLICIREKPDVIITSTFSIYFFLYLKIISLVFRVKFIREKNEVDYMDEDFIFNYQKLVIKILSSIFDGFILINNQLSEYLRFDLKIKKKSIIVPILINDFIGKKNDTIKKTIVYTGTYLERKDGILTIMHAFSKVLKKYPDYKLVFTGSPQKSKNYIDIKKIISSEGLQDNIIFTGYLSEKDLVNQLTTANMLILAKPDNRQNYYNFPTKIGEYLLSGRPVIATKVGVVGDILEDKKNIIITKFEINDIASKIEFVIENQELTSKIGKNGRVYALKNFYYVDYAEKMLTYFKSLS